MQPATTTTSTATAPTTSTTSGTPVYWVGADNNLYVKGNFTGSNTAAPTVQNYGPASQYQLTNSYIGAPDNVTNPLGQAMSQGVGGMYANKIADPNPPATATPTATATTAAPVTNTLSPTEIAAIKASITDGITQNQNAFTAAQKLNQGYDQQDLIDYNNQLQTNNENRASAVQNAEQAAASGSQGLRSVLASLGALDGTGSELAGRAVADSANTDIGGADKTYQTNANSIAAAQNTYKNSTSKRDADLATALLNDNRNTKSAGIQKILTAAQNIGDTSTYNQYLPQLAQALTPITPLSATQTVYNPASVSSFAPPSGLTVTAAPSSGNSSTTPVNSALYVKKQS